MTYWYGILLQLAFPANLAWRRVDLSGGYLQDAQPRYPQPFGLLSLRSQLQFIPVAMNREPPTQDLQQDVAVMRVYDALRQVDKIIADEFLSKGEDFWSTILFPGFHFSPILHDLLSMPRGTVHDGIEARRRECFRLAAVLYVTELRGKFGIDTTPAIVYTAKLYAILTSPNMLPAWGTSNVFLLWSLVVAAASPSVPEPFRLEFIVKLLQCLRSAGVRWFYELTALITDFVWSDAAMGRFLSDLERRLPPCPW